MSRFSDFHRKFVLVVRCAFLAMFPMLCSVHANAEAMKIYGDKELSAYEASDRALINIFIEKAPAYPYEVIIEANTTDGSSQNILFEKKSDRLFSYHSPVLSTLDTFQIGAFEIQINAYIQDSVAVQKIRAELEGLNAEVGAEDSNEAVRKKEHLNKLLTESRHLLETQTIVVGAGFDNTSPGALTIHDVSLNSFNGLSTPLRYSISGASFQTNESRIYIYVNNAFKPKEEFEIVNGELIVDGPWKNGLNVVRLYTKDTDGKEIEEEIRFWAGDGSTVITARDENDDPIPSAVVRLSIAESEESVYVEGVTDGNGEISFSNIPTTTVFITGTKNTLYGQNVMAGGSLDQEVYLRGLLPPTTSNLDYSDGLNGWVTEGGVSLETSGQIKSHLDSLAGIHKLKLNRADANREILRLRKGHKDRLRKNTCPQLPCSLVLNTEGQPSASASHSITFPGGTLKVRYRFQSSEYPEYYGSEFNDSYSVSVRSGNAHLINDRRSLNMFPSGAYDGTGATDWVEETFTVEPNTVIQFDFAVANVGDELYDSQLIVEAIREADFSIESLSLRDGHPGAPESDLKYLSVGRTKFMNGRTEFFADIVLKGTPGDKLKEMGVELVQNGVVRNTYSVPMSVVSGSLKEVFSSSGTLSGRVHLAVPNTGTYNDNTITINIWATSQQVADKSTKSKSVKVLKWIGDQFSQKKRNNGHRYGDENELEGGDSWADPRYLQDFKKIVDMKFTVVNENNPARTITGNMLLGDVSNMNGGRILPHKEHTNGLAADYSNWDIFNLMPHGNPEIDRLRRIRSAETIIAIVNSPAGLKLERIIVSGERMDDPEDPFWSRVLADPRSFWVVQGGGGHVDHFHIDFKP